MLPISTESGKFGSTVTILAVGAAIAEENRRYAHIGANLEDAVRANRPYRIQEGAGIGNWQAPLADHVTFEAEGRIDTKHLPVHLVRQDIGGSGRIQAHCRSHQIMSDVQREASSRVRSK